MSPGKGAELNKLMSAKISIDDYENLCRLCVLGVTGIALHDIAVHQNFKDKRRTSKDGWYETGLM